MRRVSVFPYRNCPLYTFMPVWVTMTEFHDPLGNQKGNTASGNFFLSISSSPVKLLTVHLHVTYTWTRSCLKCWSELDCVFETGKWRHETLVVYLREINDLLKNEMKSVVCFHTHLNPTPSFEYNWKLFWFYECCMGGGKQIILILQVLQCRWKGKTAGYTLIS